MRKFILALSLLTGPLVAQTQTMLNMPALYAEDQWQSLKVNYNHFTEQDWKAIDPINQYINYLANIQESSSYYKGSQNELNFIYATLKPLNTPQPQKGALELLKGIASRLVIPASGQPFKAQWNTVVALQTTTS